MGLFVMCIVSVIISSQFLPIKEKHHYFQLLSDCEISDIGYLKKGAILRFDEGMSEGFTRYILYLNLKAPDVKPFNVEHDDSIIPFWLYPKDSLSNRE